MYALALLTISGLAFAQEATESIEIVRARQARDIVLGLIPQDVQTTTLTWDAVDVDDLGRPFAGYEVQAPKDDLVFHIEARSGVAGVTPGVFVIPPGGELAPVGDISPNAGEADAWLRLHAAGAWQVFLLADTPGALGSVALEVATYDSGFMEPPPVVGTLQQTSAGTPASSSAPTPASSSSSASDIFTSELDTSDDTLDDGAYYEVFEFEAPAGQRQRLAAISDHYDLYFALMAEGTEPVRAESNELSGAAAVIDHVTTTSGVHQLAVFGKETSALGAFEFMELTILTGSVCDQYAPFEVDDPWGLVGIEDSRTPSQLRTRTLMDTMAFATSCSVEKFGIDLGVGCKLEVADEAAGRKVWEPLAQEFRSCHQGWEISQQGDSLAAVKDGRTRMLSLQHEALVGWYVSATTW